MADWITQKEKPKSWITKKKSGTKAPGTPPKKKRFRDSPYPQFSQEFKPKIKAFKSGGAVTRFRSSGPEGKPHSTKEGRSAEAQRAYMRKQGPQDPRRKRIWPKRAAKATGGRIGLKSGTKKPYGSRGFKGIHEMLGGSEKAKPHSTKEGRVASGKRRLGRLRKKAMDDYHDITWAGPDPEKGKPHSSQEGQIATGRRNFRKVLERYKGRAKPLRAKKGVGGIAKIIGRKAVEWIKKNRKTIKKEIYSPEGKKKTQDLTKKLQEGLKKPGHAKGGRIGLQHGNRPRPQGPHTWVRKKPKGVKIAIKGW